MKYIFMVAVMLISSMAYAQDENEQRKFAGINFGVGISLTYDIGGNDRIESALLDENGIVRVTKDRNQLARVMLETHYFFEPKSTGKGFLGIVPASMWGHGPFVALQPGTDEIIEAIGLGWMVGFRRTATGSESWNLGFGYVVDPSVQILGDDLNENQALPAGETQIRFKETSQTGLFVLASFNF